MLPEQLRWVDAPSTGNMPGHPLTIERIPWNQPVSKKNSANPGLILYTYGAIFWILTGLPILKI